MQCNYSYSAFNNSTSVQLQSTSNWVCSSSQRTIAANGIPDHAVGTFPNANNPNAITTQVVSASYTLAPVLTTVSRQLGGPAGVAAYILNGVKVDAATAGTCNDAGTCDAAGNIGAWHLEAINSGFNFGVDSNNAHVQPGGAYHYHGIPEGFVTRLNKGVTMTLIGWAADGFPIYARYGYTVATNASSPLKIVTSSYQLKAAPNANRPSATLWKMGTFQEDYTYTAGSGDLDDCNGRFGVTPEFPNGIYHYYATDTYPFLQRCVKGQ